MFIPLVDTLRCPHAHEDTWLVASIERVDNRDIISGALGCPKCFAEFPIRDGVVQFDDAAPRPPYRALSEEDAVRIAAALDLTDARMTAALQGEWGVLAPVIAGMSPAQLLLVNPPDGIASGDAVSIVRALRAPVARETMSAAAFDASASDEMVASVAASVKPRGRLLGPASSPIPEHFTELVRDDEVWVAERDAGATSAPVSLSRRKSG